MSEITNTNFLLTFSLEEQKTVDGRKIHFLICGSCFWCASCIVLEKKNINICPSCNGFGLDSIPISIIKWSILATNLTKAHYWDFQELMKLEKGKKVVGVKNEMNITETEVAARIATKTHGCKKKEKENSKVETPIHQFSDIEITEITKSAEKAHKYIQIAFAEDLYLYCQANDINFLELRNALNSKWNVNILEPKDGIGRHCLPKDTRRFLQSSKSVKSKILNAAIEVDQDYKKFRLSKEKRELVAEKKDKNLPIGF